MRKAVNTKKKWWFFHVTTSGMWWPNWYRPLLMREQDKNTWFNTARVQANPIRLLGLPTNCPNCIRMTPKNNFTQWLWWPTVLCWMTNYKTRFSSSAVLKVWWYASITKKALAPSLKNWPKPWKSPKASLLWPYRRFRMCYRRLKTTSA